MIKKTNGAASQLHITTEVRKNTVAMFSFFSAGKRSKI
jgi:hypothetical protein